MPSRSSLRVVRGDDQKRAGFGRSGKRKRKSVGNRLWSRREVKIRHRGSPRNQENGLSQLVCPKSQHNGSRHLISPSGVHQPDARSPSDRRLVPPHQLRRRLPVPGPNATEQHLEAFIPRGRIPHRCRDLRFPTRSSRAAEPDGTFMSDYGDHRHPCCIDRILIPHPLHPPPLRRGCPTKNYPDRVRSAPRW